MFLGLTNINNETADIEPELAESWETSADGTVWTFNLRQNAVWSDGQPVTANDVVYNVRRAIMPETASPYACVLYIIQNAKTINQTAVPHVIFFPALALSLTMLAFNFLGDALRDALDPRLRNR